MRLITTALRFPESETGPCLLLGEWCKLFGDRDRWAKIPHEVLPYHWDNRDVLLSAYGYLDRLYERVLAELSLNLNIIHNVEHGSRYWRIVLGPWLFTFLVVLYDRYLSVQAAKASGKVSAVTISSKSKHVKVPYDLPEFSEWCVNDEYNDLLYGFLIERVGGIPFEIEDRENDDIKPAVSRSSSDAFNPLALFNNLVPEGLRKIVPVSTYLKFYDALKLELSLGQVPFITTPVKERFPWEIDPDMRARVRFRAAATAFENIVNELLGRQMPVIYMERYRDMERVSMRNYPGHPKAILTGNAYQSDEGFKFWAAAQTEKGAKLAGVQYGGVYGSGEGMSIEEHSLKIYDRFYTWGWESDVHRNTKYLPAAKFNSAIKNVRADVSGGILMVEAAMPRYACYMYGLFTSATGQLKYMEDQYDFARALPVRIRARLNVRLYHHDYRWAQKDRWNLECPGVKVSFKGGPMLDEMNRSRLFIGTYNSTAYLEALAADFPTVLFWDKDAQRVRPSARPYFDKLEKAGLYFSSAKKAAEKVTDIFDDVQGWWHSPEVKKARAEFCFRFARTDRSWLKIWKEELVQLSREALIDE